MAKQTYAPLRSTVGSIVHQQANLIAQSPALTASGAQLTVQTSTDHNVIPRHDYSTFLPRLSIDSPAATLLPIQGSERYPTPIDTPFELFPQVPIVSVSTLLPEGPSVPSSRLLWLEIEVRFERPELLGGMLYNGLPSLPSYIDEQGQNSANAGLPREISLRWGGNNAGVIDDECSLTSQEIVSHGGVHYLCIPPVMTDRVVLRFSDFPRILTKIKYTRRRTQGHGSGGVIGGNTANLPEYICSGIEERFGCVVPVIAFFTHAQGVKYRPHVSCGLLGIRNVRSTRLAPVSPERPPPGGGVKPPAKDSREGLSAGYDRVEPPGGGVKLPAKVSPPDMSDYFYFASHPDRTYIAFGGGSVFGQRRAYEVPNARPAGEIFCSNPLAPTIESRYSSSRRKSTRDARRGSAWNSKTWAWWECSIEGIRTYPSMRSIRPKASPRSPSTEPNMQNTERSSTRARCPARGPTSCAGSSGPLGRGIGPSSLGTAIPTPHRSRFDGWSWRKGTKEALRPRPGKDDIDHVACWVNDETILIESLANGGPLGERLYAYWIQDPRLAREIMIELYHLSKLDNPGKGNGTMPRLPTFEEAVEPLVDIESEAERRPREAAEEAARQAREKTNQLVTVLDSLVGAFGLDTSLLEQLTPEQIDALLAWVRDVESLKGRKSALEKAHEDLRAATGGKSWAVLTGLDRRISMWLS